VSVTIKQSNPNAIADVLKRYRNSKQLAIGYPIGTSGTSTKYPDGTPVLLVAAVQNFGADIDHPGGTRFVVSGGKARFVSNDFVGPVMGVTKAHKINVPARDFMTQGGVRALEKTGPISAKLIKKLNAGEMTIDQILDVLGPVAVAEFQQTIIDINDPPNAPSTVRKKGSSNPLVDTGLMNQTLTHIVRGK
jgi:hypothetical protein